MDYGEKVSKPNTIHLSGTVSGFGEFLRYLSEEKWKNGFVCTKCGHTHYFETKDRYSRQCTKCRHTESPTAGTLFHRMKFPILKAFYIVYYVATSKSGISSTELSRKLGLRQKTCWLFKQKSDACHEK